MAYPMAENLLQASYSLTVFSRTRQKANEQAGRGA